MPASTALGPRIRGGAAPRLPAMTITEPTVSARPAPAPAPAHRPGSCHHELDLLESALMELGATVEALQAGLQPVLVDEQVRPGDTPGLDTVPASPLASRTRQATDHVRRLTGDLGITLSRLGLE